MSVPARPTIADPYPDARDAYPIVAAGGTPAVGLTAEAEPEPRLPGDHPPWARDIVSLSQRARDLFARLRPIALRIFFAWEHRVRSIFIGGRRLEIDSAGCYRAD